jgi:hypothetical protein
LHLALLQLVRVCWWLLQMAEVQVLLWMKQAPGLDVMLYHWPLLLLLLLLLVPLLHQPELHLPVEHWQLAATQPLGQPLTLALMPAHLLPVQALTTETPCIISRRQSIQPQHQIVSQGTKGRELHAMMCT